MKVMTIVLSIVLTTSSLWAMETIKVSEQDTQLLQDMRDLFIKKVVTPKKIDVKPVAVKAKDQGPASVILKNGVREFTLSFNVAELSGAISPLLAQQKVSGSKQDPALIKKAEELIAKKEAELQEAGEASTMGDEVVIQQAQKLLVTKEQELESGKEVLKAQVDNLVLDLTDKGFDNKVIRLVIDLFGYAYELKQAIKQEDQYLTQNMQQQARNRVVNAKLSSPLVEQMKDLLINYLQVDGELFAKLLVNPIVKPAQ